MLWLKFHADNDLYETEMRQPILIALVNPLLLLCLIGAPTVRPNVVRADDRPNVLLIMCDDMGWSDLGCYGSQIETPHLDRLAAEGMRFRTFYNNAKCEHTRASLLTGHWWHHVGASPTVTYAAQTIGTRLRDAGYRTWMTGKWHAGQTPPQRGFDRYYGLTDGCCNFWNPGHARPDEPEPAKKKVRRWAIDDQEFLPFTPEKKDFYTTDAFTDHAIDYLHQYENAPEPFFLYVAYTAPHYPLHASQKDVAKYRGRFGNIGWNDLRRRRFEKQRSIGILPHDCGLSPADPSLPRWDSILPNERDAWDLRMSTYAAMIDRMDQNIGRLLQTLDDVGESDNTIILFLSDNGACEDSKDRSTVGGSMPWEVTSYLTQGRTWANASNTPFRRYKTTNYEGGTRTPLIAHHPATISPGGMTDSVGHIIDLMPTLLDFADQDIPPELPGRSLRPTLEGHDSELEPMTFYWDFNRSRAIRDGRYKAINHRRGTWELYDLVADPIEQNDLSEQQPERLAKLVSNWNAWRKSELAVPVAK